MEDNYEQDPVEPNVDKDQGVNKDQGLQTENREELQQLLLQLTEEKVLTRFSDLHLDRENEILHLLDGSKITVREFRQMQAFVTTELQDCGPQFERDFYRHIFRLKGWTYVEGQREKPWPVATYTNELFMDVTLRRFCRRFNNLILIPATDFAVTIITSISRHTVFKNCKNLFLMQ